MRACACLLAFVVATLAGASATGCSSNGGSGARDAGSSALQSSGHDVNPYGVPYPPAPGGGYGHVARTGSTPGSILQNFKFYGFVGGAIPSPDKMSVVSLADFYDPCGKSYKLIHLSAAAVWCGPCNQETAALVAAKSDLAAKGVVVLQFLFEGAGMGQGVTQGTLEAWIRQHGSNFTELLDSELEDPNLGGFFDTAAIPWNADVDPRTMELLTSTEGFGGSVDDELSVGLADVAKAPAYPLAATAKCP